MIFSVGKDSQCAGLTTLPPSGDYCLKIMESSSSWTSRGLSRNIMGYFYRRLHWGHNGRSVTCVNKLIYQFPHVPLLHRLGQLYRHPLSWRNSPTRAKASSFLRFLGHTQWHTTVGRNPLDEWSASRRDLYPTTHNYRKTKTSMPLTGFEPAIPAIDLP